MTIRSVIEVRYTNIRFEVNGKEVTLKTQLNLDPKFIDRNDIIDVLMCEGVKIIGSISTDQELSYVLSVDGQEFEVTFTKTKENEQWFAEKGIIEYNSVTTLAKELNKHIRDILEKFL